LAQSLRSSAERDPQTANSGSSGKGSSSKGKSPKSARQRPLRRVRPKFASAGEAGLGSKTGPLSPNARTPKARLGAGRKRPGGFSRLLPHEKIKIPSPGQFHHTHNNSSSAKDDQSTQLVASVKADFLSDDVSAEFVAYRDLEFTDVLGSGTSGDVYRGYYREEKLVAIKVLERDRDASVEDFINEYKIMASVRGPHVLEVFGAVLEPKPCLVMEYCSRGSLYDLLQDPQVEVNWPVVLRFAREIFLATATLHSHEPKVVHRDLKSANFLVAEDWTLKVCE
jgi:Protein tyrosine and serine/threonine kinase